MTRGLARRKRILILSPEGPRPWGSHMKIIAALEKQWVKEAALAGFEVLSELPSGGGEAVDAIAVTFLTRALQKQVVELRAGLKTTDRFVPCFFHLHSEPSFACLQITNPGELFRKGDHYLVASQAEKKLFGLYFDLPNVIVNPFPIELLDRASAPAKQRAGQVSKSASFAYVGRISRQKNIDVLFRALAQWKQEGQRGIARRFSLDVFGVEDEIGIPQFGIGCRGYQEFVRHQAMFLGLEANVRWKGPRSNGEVLARLRARRPVLISLSTNLDENYGVAVHEAILSGCQVVLSDWGGHRDFKSRFPKQTHLVPVRFSEDGPLFELDEVCAAIDRALRVGPMDGDHHAFRANPAVQKALTDVLEGKLALNGDLPATETEHRKRVLSRMTSDWLFTGYGDPLLKPHLAGYGARR